MKMGRTENFYYRMGLDPLSPVWAKLEIIFGLGVVWCAIKIITIRDVPDFVSLGLFVLGGYLAMAGSRSHLYQSSNATAAFLLEAIEKQPSTPAT